MLELDERSVLENDGIEELGVFDVLEKLEIVLEVE